MADSLTSWARGPAAPLAAPVAAPRAGGEPAAHERRPWWVYASIAGAVALGAGVILANELADDHQRVELTWP